MRTDTLGPRTWLLAGLAGWAFLVWVLALFGLGGQIRPLPSDPSLVTGLPQLPAKVPERLGPLSQYPYIAAQPLFSPSRQPQPFFISGDGTEATKTFDFVLTSVLMTSNFQMAILQPAAGGEGIRLKVGDSPEAAPAWRLTTVNPRSAVFDGPEGQRTLELRVFDGNGGQPPTAMTPVPVAPGSAPPVAMPGAGPSGTQPPSNMPKATQVLPAAGSAVPAPGMPAADAVLTTEQQMDTIRKRIEARRAQLRAQGESPPPPNKTK